MKIEFITGQIYHLYNRGVDKRDVFLSKMDYIRFLSCLWEFNRVKPIGSLRDREKIKRGENRENRGRTAGAPAVRPLFSVDEEPLVEIISYCLNPNHFYLIVRQLKDGGISEFMKRLSGGYTGFFNKKYSRTGSLFGGGYKGVFIDSPEYALLLSAYVNCNNFIHGLSKNLADWEFSSYSDYIGKRSGKLCQKDVIYKQIKKESLEEKQKFYRDFCKEQALYLKEKKRLEKFVLE